MPRELLVLAPYHISKLKLKRLFILLAAKKVSKIFLRLLMVNTCPIRIHNYVFHIISFKIMQLILKNKNESNITSTLNISQQTLKIQKFNIMYKLKLRRMSDIVTLGITSYF
ncbi:DNA-binding transcriptional activator [Escherichia coli]|uniref:DNA-binding transcriptional activator n=1 Tax=Escherichia coli TaxID=562 RepID=A0A377APB9_ECOLX|nr:DNA-binding transcriptional activator [Escherichia coli]